MMKRTNKIKRLAFRIAAIAFTVLFAISFVMLTKELRQSKKEANTFAELAALRQPQQEASARPEPTPTPVATYLPAPIRITIGENGEIHIVKPEKAPAAAVEEPTEQMNEPTPLQVYLPLYERNPEFFAWITIPDTNIDYPVMYSPARRNYYLTHDFYGGKAATGVPYLDEDCDPEGSFYLVYGHHPNLGTMFSQLIRYEDRAFWETHREIRFDTLYEERTYAVAIAMRARVLDQNEQHGFRYYNYTSLDTEEEFGAYIRQAGEKSLYDTGIDLSYGDELLVLSTCYHYTRNGRFVVVAKRIG